MRLEAKYRPQYASVNRDAREKAPEWTLNVMGNGATDPKGGGEPGFGTRDRTAWTIPTVSIGACARTRRHSVKDWPILLAACRAEARERLFCASNLWSVPCDGV
jgi:hypothetical protein